MKIKIGQIRTYSSEGLRLRAACLCVRSQCETEVLLVSSSRCSNLWVVPGGGLEPGEDPAETAVREVLEEAGAIGHLGRQLGVYENYERNTRTYVYILVVEHLKIDYDDARGIGRLRRWFTLSEADERLRQHKPVQTRYLKDLRNDKLHIERLLSCSKAAEAYKDNIINSHLQQQDADLHTTTTTTLPTVLPPRSLCPSCQCSCQCKLLAVYDPPPPVSLCLQLCPVNNNNSQTATNTVTSDHANGNNILQSIILQSAGKTALSAAATATSLDTCGHVGVVGNGAAPNAINLQLAATNCSSAT